MNAQELVSKERWVRAHDHPAGGRDAANIGYIRDVRRNRNDCLEIATVFGCDRDELQAARADLIAAAPDLLAACEAARAFIGSLELWRSSDPTMAPNAFEILQSLKSAIAKARGETGGEE